MAAINLGINKVIKVIDSKKLFISTFEIMDAIYGEQSHIPIKVMLELARIYPQLFLEAVDGQGRNLGHLILLPFNSSGLAKITDDQSYEEDFTLSDFEISTDKNAPIYLFVYSIYGKNKITSAKLVLKTYEAIEKLNEFKNTTQSFIFAEVVSEEGKRISEKMNMSHYHTYNFEGDELELYKASFNDFLTAKKAYDLITRERKQE